MVIRCHPIRVAGDSGPLAGETTWRQLRPRPDCRLIIGNTLRSLAKFAALGVSIPTWYAARSQQIIRAAWSEHLDYVDPHVRAACLTAKAREFVEKIEHDIERRVDWLGTGPESIIERHHAKSITTCFSSSQSTGRKCLDQPEAKKSRARHSASTPTAELR